MGAMGLGIGIILFAFGAALGFLAAYLLLPNESRVKKLQAELEELRQRHESYRSDVNRHFQRTGELFQGMTEQYRAIYQHLAGGAQALCDVRPSTLALDPRDSGRLPAQDAASSASEPRPEQASAARTSAASRAPDEDGDEGNDSYLGDAPHVPEFDGERASGEERDRRRD